MSVARSDAEVELLVLLVLLLKSADRTDRKSLEKTPSELEFELTMIRYVVAVALTCICAQSYRSGVAEQEATICRLAGLPRPAFATT